MYTIIKKKQRYHKREYKNIISKIKNINPKYDVDCIYGYEIIKVHGNLFFKPKGKYKKDIFCELINKTEYIVKNKPEHLKFCTVVLCVGNNLAHVELLIFFDELKYKDFFYRNNKYQKWEKCEYGSLLEEIGLKTNLREYHYIETIEDDDINFKTDLWFYIG